MKRVLIIIPTYNESKNIEELIKRILEVSKISSGYEFRILFIDDNSPDGTGELLEKIKAKYQIIEVVIHRKEKLGLASAYILGFKYAIRNNFDIVFEMDADLSHNPDYIPEFLKKYEQGYEVVIGSRYLYGISVVNWPINRLIISYLASIYVRTIMNMNIKDPTSGFKLFNIKVLKHLNLDGIKSNGYSFQIENIFKAWKNGFKTIEIPIIFIERAFGKSKMNRKIALEAMIRVPMLKITSILRGKNFK